MLIHSVISPRRNTVVVIPNNVARFVVHGVLVNHHCLDDCFLGETRLSSFTLSSFSDSSRRKSMGISGTGFVWPDVLPVSQSTVSKH